MLTAAAALILNVTAMNCCEEARVEGARCETVALPPCSLLLLKLQPKGSRGKDSK